MNQAEAQEVVRQHLKDEDLVQFNNLTGQLEDYHSMPQEEFIKKAEELTELFDLNELQIIAQQMGSLMNLTVLHKGKEVK